MQQAEAAKSTSGLPIAPHDINLQCSASPPPRLEISLKGHIVIIEIGHKATNIIYMKHLPRT